MPLIRCRSIAAGQPMSLIHPKAFNAGEGHLALHYLLINILITPTSSIEPGKLHLLIRSCTVVATQSNRAEPDLLNRTYPVTPLQSDPLHHTRAIESMLSILQSPTAAYHGSSLQQSSFAVLMTSKPCKASLVTGFYSQRTVGSLHACCPVY